MSEEVEIPDAVPVNNDPAMVVAASPHTLLPKKREVVMFRPGNINVAGDRGNYPGCRAICFGGGVDVKGLEKEDYDKFLLQMQEAGAFRDGSPEFSANLYFKHRANMLTVSESADSNGQLHYLVTNQLEDVELEDFMDFSREWEAHSAERKEARQLRKREEAEAAQKKDAEIRALAEIGKKVRDHNMLEKFKQQEEELESLKKKLRKLEGKK
jgi:hypothetical protein